MIVKKGENNVDMEALKEVQSVVYADFRKSKDTLPKRQKKATVYEHPTILDGYTGIKETNKELNPKKEGSYMDWQEKYIDKVDRDIDEVKNTITASEDRISRMIESTMTEMRDRDNQRLHEMSEIRASMENMQESMRSERRWVIGTTLSLAITAIIGIATMIITVLVSK